MLGKNQTDLYEMLVTNLHSLSLFIGRLIKKIVFFRQYISFSRSGYIVNDSPWRKQRGVSMVETLIVAPVLIFMGFGTIQMGYLWEAKNITNYAALMAARAGSTSGLDMKTMQMAAVKALRPILSNQDLLEYSAGEIGAIPIEVLVVNPTIESFTRFHDGATPCDGILCIPNSFLDVRGDISIGTETLSDANLLRVELYYNYPLVVPVLGEILKSRSRKNCIENSICTPNPIDFMRIPVHGVATVRMQSISQLDANNLDNVLRADCILQKITDTGPNVIGVIGGGSCPIVDFN